MFYFTCNESRPAFPNPSPQPTNSISDIKRGMMDLDDRYLNEIWEEYREKWLQKTENSHILLSECLLPISSSVFVIASFCVPWQ